MLFAIALLPPELFITPQVLADEPDNVSLCHRKSTLAESIKSNIVCESCHSPYLGSNWDGRPDLCSIIYKEGWAAEYLRGLFKDEVVCEDPITTKILTNHSVETLKEIISRLNEAGKEDNPDSNVNCEDCHSWLPSADWGKIDIHTIPSSRWKVELLRKLYNNNTTLYGDY